MDIVYRKGKEMYISFHAFGNPSKIEHVNIVQYLPIRPERLEQLKTETENDETLQLLKTVIRDW